MAENRTLLSQNEIDTLVSFLMSQKDVSIGNVLDQASIDKLIDLVQFNNQNGIYFSKDQGLAGAITQAQVIDDDFVISKDSCTLEIATDSNGFIEVFCRNNENGKQIHLTPTCLEQKKYIPDDNSEWGYCITPKHFNKLANLFGVSYSAETFDAVCHNFAKVVFGNESAEIPNIYYPLKTD